MPKGIYERKVKRGGWKLTPETRSKMGKAKWKGDKAGNTAKHLWVEKWKGKPKKCEQCGTETAKKYEWANIDHKYRRVLEDYIRMCSLCHRRYDIKNNGWHNQHKPNVQTS